MKATNRVDQISRTGSRFGRNAQEGAGISGAHPQRVGHSMAGARMRALPPKKPHSPQSRVVEHDLTRSRLPAFPPQPQGVPPMTKPLAINPVQWTQALGLARQSCARIFRDGGSPDDAARAYGLDGASDWDNAIKGIATSFCIGSR